MTDSSTNYEVRCLNCDVSFPVEQKRCIHCGATLRGMRARAQRFTPTEALQEFGLESDPRPVVENPGLGPVLPSPLQEEDDSEKETGRFGFLRGGMTLIWIILAGLYSILRACGEG